MKKRRKVRRKENDGSLLGDLKGYWLGPVRNPEGATLPTN